MTVPPDCALLVVDVQRDFCSGGALAVPDGDAVVPLLNRCIELFEEGGAPVYASRDWHPAVTSHFKLNGGPWPVHCVAGTAGASFHEALRLSRGAIVVTKGQDPGAHGYSAFDGTTAEGVPLLDDLRRRGVRHLFVGGLATDYCVKCSVLDALNHGLRVTVLGDGVRGVDVQSGDSARAMAEMTAAGAVVSTTACL